MKLSVAIPTYNRSYFLDNNLKQLFKEYDNNFEIMQALTTPKKLLKNI